MPPGVEQQDTVTVLCTCGKKLKAPASAVGRKARCKACGSTLTITAPPPPVPGAVPPIPPARKGVPPIPTPAQAAAAAKSARPAAKKPTPVEEHHDDDGLSALYDLAKVEKSAEIIDEDVRCPQCVSPLAANAVICTNCGYNVRTGKAIQTQTVAAKPKKSWFGKKEPKPGQVQDAMAPQGSFMMGVLGSVGGGIIGGLVWFLIAHFTGYEVGYVALGVGALAGLGMQLGQKGYSQLGGVVAALVAFLAIMGAKAAVFAVIIMGATDELDESMASLEDYDDRVVEVMLDREYEARNLDYDETSEEEDEVVYKAVAEKLGKMSPTEMNAMIAEADAQEEKDELVGHLTEQSMSAYEGSTGNSADFKQMIEWEKQAETKVAAMTPEQQKAELAKFRAAEEAEAAAEEEAYKKHAEATGKSLGDDDEDGSGKVVAFAIGALILYMIFGGIWSLIFTFLAVSVAYKTASGGVSG